MRPPFLAWPGWPSLRFAWLLSGLNALWFALIYGGCDWITAQHHWRVRIHLPIELSIPLVPGAVVVYMSIYLLFLAGPFIVRERREFATLIGALALATLVGGLGFLLIPGQLAFLPPTEADLGRWAALFHFADRLNLDYDLVPSLHVALSVGCIAVFTRHAPLWGRVLLWAWAVAIALSTILTHQHHLIDALSGWLVGLGADSGARRLTRSRAS